MKIFLSHSKNKLKSNGLIPLVILLTFFTLPIFAQDATFLVKGKVSDEIGPLENAVVVLKGTDKGVATDTNGLFTFPEKLPSGAILVVSYLGYEKQEVMFTSNLTFLDITLSEENIDILEALMVEDIEEAKKKQKQKKNQ